MHNHPPVIELPEIEAEAVYHQHAYGAVLAVDRLYDVHAGQFPVFYTRYLGKIYCSTSCLHLADATNHFAFNPFCRWVMRQSMVHVIWYPFFHTYFKGIYRIKPFTEVTIRGTHSIAEYRPAFFHFERDVNAFIRLTAEKMIECVHHYEDRYPNHKHIVAVGGMDARFILAVPKKKPQNWIVYSLPPDASSVREFVKVNKMPYECWFPEWPPVHPETEAEYLYKMLITQCLTDPVHFREAPVLAPYLKPNEKYLFWTGDLGDCLTTVQPEYQRYNSLLFYSGLSSRGTAYQGFSSLYMLGALGIPYVPFYHYPPLWKEVFLKFSPSIIQYDTRHDILSELDKQLNQKTISVKGPGTPAPTPRLPFRREEVMVRAARLVEEKKNQGIINPLNNAYPR